MKKMIKFRLFKTKFIVPISFFILIGLCFVFGIVVSFFLDFDTQNEIFSPFIISFKAQTGFALPIFLHSFLYFLLFPIIGFILGASFFGFFIIPFLMFFKAVFCAVALISLFSSGQTAVCFTLFAPLVTLEILALHIYLAQAMCVSKSLFAKDEEPSIIFQHSLRQFSIIALYMLCLSIFYGLWQYLIL